MKDVEVNVENLDNGVKVKITSKDPEVAKKLQAYAAKIKEKHSQKKAVCTQKSEKKEIKYWEEELWQGGWAICFVLKIFSKIY